MKGIFIGILILFLSLKGFSIHVDSTKSIYINLGVGVSYSYFRDYATSPLIYAGKPINLSLSRYANSNKRISCLGGDYKFGFYQTNVNNYTGLSTVNSLNIFYGQLYKYNRWNKEKYNLKLGGLINITGNFRINKALMNNAYGYELIPTAFGSARITRDISREVEKNRKILFIKYKLKPIKREISYQFNLGIFNSNFRNGYVYNNQSEIINEIRVFDQYKFNPFSGFRLSSALNYTKYLPNKNAFLFSYIWDAYQTGGEFEKFEFFNHTLMFSLLFNTK